MGNASWVQLSGHSAVDAAPDGHPLAARRVERLGTGRQRCPLTGRDAAGLLRLAVLLRAHRRAAIRRSADLAEYRCQSTGLGRRTDRADRLDLPRRLVGRHPGSAGVGGVAAGRRGDLRDGRHGFAAVAAAHRIARTDPLRPAGVASALGARRIRLAAAAVVAGIARGAAAAPVAEYLEMTRGAIDFNRPGHTGRGFVAVGAYRRDIRKGAPRPRRHRQRRSPNGPSNTTSRWST